MKKPLATIALAGISLLLTFAACNNASGPGVNPSAPNAPAATVHHGRVHRGDSGPQDLHAGGSDFDGYAYNLLVQPVGLASGNPAQPGPGVGSLFYEAPTVGSIYYCLNSSGHGREDFEENYKDEATEACPALGAAFGGFGGRQDPLDFVGSSIGIPAEASSWGVECCASGTVYYDNRYQGSPSWGWPFQFPNIGGVIVFAYWANGLTSTIDLSTWTYCAIANGTVYNWDDPAITADNGGNSVDGGENNPITFYYRSDSSGTSYNFTYALNTYCNPSSWPAPYDAAPYQAGGRSAAWTYGPNSNWPGPKGTGPASDPYDFVGENGAPALTAAIQSTQFSTGYLEGAYARGASGPKLDQADLQNGYKKKTGAVFINPTSKTAIGDDFKGLTPADIETDVGSDNGDPLDSGNPGCILLIPNSDLVSPAKGAYPIYAVTYLLFYGNNNGVHTSDKETLIKWIESSAVNKYLQPLEYSPLPASIQSAVLTAYSSGGAGSTACVQ